MRILMASKRAPGTPGRRDGGVQTWTMTVAEELARQGHHVDIVAARGLPLGAPYDLGLFANAGHTAPLTRFCGTSLLVCHGIVPDEGPTDGFDAVAFTSEEVRDHWGGNGPIIRQPIDLDFWSPDAGRARYGLLRYANRGGLEWLPAVADRLRMPYMHLRNATPCQARDALRGAACVLASGRAAVEAMACGAPTVICDDRAYQGPLIDKSVFSMVRNYSGRGGCAPTPANVAAAIEDAVQCDRFRRWAQDGHDVRRIAPQLLEAACCTC